MPNTEIEIKDIQFKRGEKAVLEAKLIAEHLGVPKAGEPIYETDTQKLKIGDGITAYKDLTYSSDHFIIKDPLSNQVLFYDATLNAWINKNLADAESIIYMAERGLTIKGYDQASQGYMLVKDQAEGLAWVQPLSYDAVINERVKAEAAAQNASGFVVSAEQFAGAAATSATIAEKINTQTMNLINEKFWWGSLEDYNQKIAAEGLNPGTFYFITPEK